MSASRSSRRPTRTTPEDPPSTIIPVRAAERPSVHRHHAEHQARRRRHPEGIEGHGHPEGQDGARLAPPRDPRAGGRSEDRRRCRRRRPADGALPERDRRDEDDGEGFQRRSNCHRDRLSRSGRRIRSRAKHAAEVAKKGDGAKVEHSGEGTGGGGLGRCPIVVEGDTTVDVKEIEGGVEVEVKSKKDVAALQKEVKLRAANFAGKSAASRQAPSRERAEEVADLLGSLHLGALDTERAQRRSVFRLDPTDHPLRLDDSTAFFRRTEALIHQLSRQRSSAHNIRRGAIPTMDPTPTSANLRCLKLRDTLVTRQKQRCSK